MSRGQGAECTGEGCVLKLGGKRARLVLRIAYEGGRGEEGAACGREAVG